MNGTETQNGTGTLVCPRCQALNPVVARFCGTCSRPLVPGMSTPQPPPLSPPRVPPSVVTDAAARFGSTGGSGGHWTINADQATAFGMVSDAVRNGGAKVVSESAPYSMKLSKSKGGFRYDGQVELQPLSASQTAVRVTIKPSSGAIAVTLICGMIGIMTMPYILGSLGALVSLGLTAWNLWNMTRGEPSQIAEALLASLPQGNAGFGAPRGFAPRDASLAPQVPPRPPAPPVQLQGESPATPAALPSSPLEALKQLAELKAIGAISQDEFDLKKADLLKRL